MHVLPYDCLWLLLLDLYLDLRCDHDSESNDIERELS